MKITKDTKISRLLKEDDRILDLIVSISPVFKKLTNPLLRRSIAPRVTVKDAARIGGMTPNDFLRRLAEAGYEVELDPDEKVSVVPKQCDVLQQYKIHSMDVRPVLEAGQDPFLSIKDQLNHLAPDEALEVILDFEPLPLIDLFSRDGFRHCTKCDKDGTVRTYFFKPLPKQSFWGKLKSLLFPSATGKNLQKGNRPVQIPVHGAEVFDRTKARYGDKLQRVDVRGLEMPAPMMTILEKLASLPEDHALLVEHERIPQYLLPELKKRQLQIAAREEAPGHVRLLIYKD